MKFQFFFNFNGHGISLDLYGFIISGSRLQSSLEIQEPWFWGMSLSRSTQHILLKGNFGVHPCLWHLQRGFFLDTHEIPWDNVNNGQCMAVRTLITWNEMWYIGRGQFECQLWFPGKTPLEYANLMMGKASWLRGWGPKHCSVTMA